MLEKRGCWRRGGGWLINNVEDDMWGMGCLMTDAGDDVNV
jgi:hypothetical protein